MQVLLGTKVRSSKKELFLSKLDTPISIWASAHMLFWAPQVQKTPLKPCGRGGPRSPGLCCAWMVRAKFHLQHSLGSQGLALLSCYHSSNFEVARNTYKWHTYACTDYHSLHRGFWLGTGRIKGTWCWGDMKKSMISIWTMPGLGRPFIRLL